VRFMVKFSQEDYRGENVVFNGDAMGVAFANSNQSRSPFASFLLAQDVIVRDGLLSGALSTAWPLLNVADGKPKLTVEGVKKVDGVSAYQVRYKPRKRGVLQILLYFDQETFRHIKTIYSTSVANNVGASITESVKLQPERTILEERFSDFTTAEGITLPSHYNIHFTQELQDGKTTVYEWDMKANEVSENMSLDPRNFQVK